MILEGVFMNIHYLEQIKNCIPDVSQRYYKQVVVFEYTDGNTVKTYAEKHSLPYINVNIEISKQLKDVPVQRRTYKITELFQQLIGQYIDKVICLDYYEILFEPSLAIEPFQLIKSNSRNKTLIISWRGKIVGDTLIHAEPGHPEYKKYVVQDAFIIK